MFKPPQSHHLAARCVAIAALAAGLLPAAQAAGTVEVTWLHPEQYADAGRSVIDRERTLQALGEHLQQLGRKLPDGQTLRLEVLDLNLAGEIEPWGWHEMRVLRGRADWPRISVRYTLLADGQSLRSGQADLADMAYTLGDRGGAYGYEKRLLDDWFKTRFAAR